MFQHEFQAWSYLAKSWRTLSFSIEVLPNWERRSTGKFRGDNGRVWNKEFVEYDIRGCIEKMFCRGMIQREIEEKMLSKIKMFLHKRAANAGVFTVTYLFPRDQQGAESRRKLCLQLAFQNIIEEHGGKLPATKEQIESVKAE